MRYLSGVVGAMAVVLMSVGFSAADPLAAEPPVGFADAEPIATSCAELGGGGVRIPVRNETAVRQRVGIGVELTRDNGRSVQPRAVCGGLETLPPSRSLRPGQGATLKLLAPNPVRKGSFAGTVAVFARHGRVARKELTITNEPAPPQGLDATPWTPSVSADLHPAETGPVWIPVQGSTADLPPVVASEAATPGTVVGAVSGPGDPVAVVFKGESRPLGTEASQVGVELEGDLSPGTYSGEVDLAPEDPESGTVSLVVRVSDEWWIAALALLGGILLGIVLLRASGRTLPRARLLGRVAGLDRRHRDARDALDAAAAGKSWGSAWISDLKQLKEKLQAEIEEATGRLRVLVRIEKSAIDNIEAAIAVVEAQVDLLKEIPKHARPLEAVLQLPRAKPPAAQDAAAGESRLDREAKALLEAGGVRADDLKPKLEEMDRRAKQIAKLRNLEARLEVLRLKTAKLNNRPVGKLVSLTEALDEIGSGLWEAKGDDDLQAIGEMFPEAVELLAAAQAMQKDPQTDAAKATAAQDQAETAIALTQTIVGASAGAPAVAAAMQPLVVSVPQTPPPPQLTDDDSKKAVLRALKIQVFVVFVSAILAIASGLGALYVGKTWGTYWDVIAAVVWGTAAQTVVTALVTSLDDLGALAFLARR
jgi:hypothetical protein